MKKKNDSFEILVDIISEKEEKKQAQAKAVKDSASAFVGAISNLASSKAKDAGSFVQDKASDISNKVDGLSKSIQEKADELGKSIQAKGTELGDKIKDFDIDTVTPGNNGWIKKTVTVETVVEENPSANTDHDGDYTVCDNCGAIITDGSPYCDNCGEMVGQIELHNAHEYVKAIKKKRRRKILAGALAALVAGTGINMGVDELTKIEVPGVEGMSAYAAEEQLEQAGYESDEIIIECDGVLTSSEIQNGEYEVISQDPDGGEKVHTSDKIHLVCKDIKKIRLEEMTACRYEKVPDVLSIADSYGFTYELNDLNGQDITKQYAALSALDQEKYFVYEQTEFNDSRKITEYTIDTEESIEKNIEKQFKKLKGETVADANKLAESLDFTISRKNEDNTDSESSSYVITGLKSVSLATKNVYITADSRDHIEELEMVKTLADKLPYEGLKEKYLAKTLIGNYDRKEDDSDNYDLDENQTAYYWSSDDGKYDVLEIICENGKVKKVNKLNKEVYWTASTPDFSADKDAYDAKVAAAAAAKEAEEKANEQMVWVSGSGNCYHSNPNCSNMKNPWEVPLSQAQNMGRRACKKCY